MLTIFIQLRGLRPAILILFVGGRRAELKNKPAYVILEHLLKLSNRQLGIIFDKL